MIKTFSIGACLSFLLCGLYLAFYQFGVLAEAGNHMKAPLAATARPNPSPGPYLTDIPAKPRAGTYFEGRRVVAGYAGYAARYRRTCDGATIDIGFAPGTDNLDVATLDAWRTQRPCNIRSRLRLVQVYDQDGRFPPLASPDANAEFATDESRLWHGRLGSLQSGAARAEVDFAGDQRAFSALVAVQPMASSERGALWTLGGWSITGGSGASLTMAGNIAPIYQSWDGGGSNTDRAWQDNPALAIRSNPSVVGWTSSPAGRTLFARGSYATSPAKPRSTAFESFALGPPPGQLGGNWARFGVILWQATLTTEEMQGAIGQVNAALAFPTRFNAMLVGVGDSILYGAGTVGFDQKGFSWFLSNALPETEFINLGLNGQKVSDELNPGFAQLVAPLLTKSPYPLRTAILWTAGTNDLSVSGTRNRSAGEVIADSVTAVKLSRAALKGVKVIRATILPRSDTGWAAMRGPDGRPKDAHRQAVNAAIVAGATQADAVVDLANPATAMGAPSAPGDNRGYAIPGIAQGQMLYVDKLHPSSVGYASGPVQAIADAVRSLTAE